MATPARIPDPAEDSGRRFINRALGFSLWQNLFKPIAPLLELICAGLFVGGAWGVYKFYESLTFLVFRVSLMGMDKGIIWYYSQVGEETYRKAVFRALALCLLAFGILGALVMGAYLGKVPYSDWVLGVGAGAFRVPPAHILLYLMAVPMMLVIELCLQANVNKRNLKYRILVPAIAVPVFTYGPAIAGRWLAPDVFILPLCLLAGNTVGAIVAVWGFLRTHRPAWRDVSVTPPAWRMMRYSFPLATANVFAAVSVRADILLLAGFAGVRSVEVFAVVSMIGKSLISIRQSFENILLSAFSSAQAGGFTLRLKHYFNYAVWLVMNMQGLLLAAAAYFGAEALGLVNAQYAAGYAALLIIAFFIYLNTVTDFAALLSLGLGRTGIVPLVNVACLAVNLGLNILWIPRWDIVGAALALGLANTTGGVIYCSYLALRHKSGLFLREYWLSTLAAGLILGLPAAWAVHAGAPVSVKAACFLASAGLMLWMQGDRYRRFNRRMSGALPEPSG